jgi:hypothetical protein
MQPAKEDSRLVHFSVDADLFQHVRSAARRAGIPTAEGSLLTSPKVLFTSEEKTAEGKRTGAIAVEMESGVHAAFATERSLPFVVLRIILDGVDLTIPAVSGLTSPAGEVRLLKAVTYVATHPRHLSTLLAINRARTIAAQSISRLCQALFLRLGQDS